MAGRRCPMRPAAALPRRSTLCTAALRATIIAGAGVIVAGVPQSSIGAPPASLPPEVQQALRRAKVPLEALAVVVQEAGSRRPLLEWNGSRPMNPASLAKLATTAAALDLLGPAWTWATPVWVQGALADGVLDGSVSIKGSGDPKLVVERVWQLLQRLQATGVREIRGDIVLDNSAFAAVEGSAADFDGESLRPYNVQPDALLMNFKAVTYTFVPDPARGVARIVAEPALAGTAVETTVPLAPGPCADWRRSLDPQFADVSRVRFAGSYPTACGEQSWPVADPHPASYNRRLVEALWQGIGGRLGGTVRAGSAPADTRPSFELRSPPLLEVVRDINKFSNNVMAQQLFLSLALARDGSRPATAAAARELLQRWLTERLGPAAAQEFGVDNGSGLSRQRGTSAAALAQLLQVSFDAPWMPELMSSLPIGGVDGTLRRARQMGGRTHLKTGSLRDVAGVAGYVLSDSGRRYVLVAIVNHPQATAARGAIDALVNWTVREAPGRSSAAGRS